MERRRQTNVEQMHLLVEFLEQHQDLALGKVRAKEARATAARLWRECALRLNSEGPARTGKEWAKVWNDMKCRVRAKLVSINANQQATGGGPSTAAILTPLEDRIGNILGRNIGPLPNVRQDPFQVTASQVDIDNVAPEVVDHDYAIPEFQTDNVEIAELNSAVLLSPTPSLSGQVLSPIPTSPLDEINRTRRERLRTRRVAGRHSAEVAPRPAQANRTVLEESRSMVLNIETMRAEAALRNSEAIKTVAEAIKTVADGFKVLAESVDRFTKEYTSRCSSQHQNPTDRSGN